MLLLDPADVPLHLAKMFKYVSDARESRDKKLAQRCTFCADRVFELFALVFLVTRIAMYPRVRWSAHVEATRYFPKGFTGVDLRGAAVDVVRAPVLLVLFDHQGRGAHAGDGEGRGRALGRRGRRPQGTVVAFWGGNLNRY